MKRIRIGNIAEIAEKRARVVRIGALEIAVFKLSDGGVKAIENRCPHKAGKLSEGIVCDHHVFCPLHDWKIDLNDGLVQAPDEGCVASFAVEVEEKSGELWLHIEEERILAS
ncbi:nitrite reductase small subunit NirD [Paenibacillus sp. J22TS3]|uniref:nitrite reductase small subunit NirD n=1 Tax=Paenibacillus sp. J22TS3 TaxID=2807192 RepID=UPI001B022F59|nr:nitrite reductase small subunit NirD [Paenibacillus sp. J22TS3]GIP23218.1 assimilatory nitrite reductase [NAD(P)H] small subunit [Paenibacillus sp. J22TS3]